MVTGQEKWSTPFTADTWFNFAYDINVSWPAVILPRSLIHTTCSFPQELSACGHPLGLPP